MAGRSQEFYHGTAHHIGGGVVLPARATGISNWGDMNADEGQNALDHAHVSTNEEAAWNFAESGAEIEGSGRARVHTVHPAPDMRKGHEFKENEEYVSKTGFKVKDTIDIKPGHQGTFPQLNWEQFTKPGHYTNANHPGEQAVDWAVNGRPQRVEVGFTKSRQQIAAEPDDPTQPALFPKPDPGPTKTRPRDLKASLTTHRIIR